MLSLFEVLTVLRFCIVGKETDWTLKKQIKIIWVDRNINKKKGKKLVGWETLKRGVELQFLICICMFFQWMRCLTRTTGCYLGLLNIMTFRKKTWLNQLRLQICRWAPYCVLITMEKHSEIETSKNMQPEFCIFYRWSHMFNRWSPWDFQSNSKNANSANKDVFNIWQNYLNIVCWLMPENFPLSGGLTKQLSSLCTI